MNSESGVTAGEIWRRTIRPEVGDFSAEGARDLMQLEFSEADKARISELGEKADEGTLTPAETEELDWYLSVGWTVEFIKAKARASLKSAA
jgi:hypothetical protein